VELVIRFFGFLLVIRVSIFHKHPPQLGVLCFSG
jgi:hypothetical protein